ncbi:MAG: cystathionine beta-lyase [Alphaproteobacteria bacterium]
MAEDTRLIHAGHHPQTGKPPSVTVSPVIQKGSTVLLPNAAALYQDDTYITYGRQGLATQDALKDSLMALENATGVELYPSGLAALTGAMLAVLKSGDEVLVTDNIYKPTRRFCDKVLAQFGISTRYFDPSQSAEDLVSGAASNVRLIVMESPGSLSFEMQDMTAVAKLARARGMLTMVDNTWGAGYFYKPLDHGIDISVQALTKYVGGHSDVFMGSAAAKSPQIAQLLSDGVLNLGWAVSPEDAYQILRGLRTLPTRLARHDASGRKIATWLASRPEVKAVLHPALEAAPGHELWARDFTGACGLFGFILHPASPAEVNAFHDALSIFGLGFSWGGFESLAIPCDAQLAPRSFLNSYGGPLVRLHVGLENPDDLITDLEAGFTALHATP